MGVLDGVKFMYSAISGGRQWLGLGVFLIHYY